MLKKEKYYSFILIGFYLFIVGQTIYDNLAPSQNVIWSNSYYVIMYFSFSLISFFQALVIPYNFIKKSLYSISGSFCFYSFYQIPKYRLTYEEWLRSMNDFDSNIIISLVSILTLIIILCHQK